jgi:hypothetical protein
MAALRTTTIRRPIAPSSMLARTLVPRSNQFSS